MSALKDNKKDRKPELKYICRGLLEETSYAMMAGALKYGDYNYLLGHSASDLLEAAVRHLYAALNGEEYDNDCTERLGLPVSHLGCAAANINMLLAQVEAGTLKEDLHSYKDRVKALRADSTSLFESLDKRLDEMIKDLNIKESNNNANYLGYLDDHSSDDSNVLYVRGPSERSDL